MMFLKSMIKRFTWASLKLSMRLMRKMSILNQLKKIKMKLKCFKTETGAETLSNTRVG